jgi:hypothetical protein
MSTNLQPRRASGPARAPRGPNEPRRFAGRVKRWSVGFTVAAAGLTWGLVTQNVVGATNATPSSGTLPAGGSGRASVPSADFFGQPAQQPQPALGNGAGGSGSAPIVRSRTS